MKNVVSDMVKKNLQNIGTWKYILKKFYLFVEKIEYAPTV
jgi:hypothetical protein